MRFLLALAAALSLAGCGIGERDWPSPTPALWEVTGTDGEHGWLFGTIHALPDGAKWRSPQVDGAIAAADVVIVEIANLDDQAQSRTAFAARARGEGLPPLLGRVAASDRPAVEELLAKAERSEREFDRVETWAAALQLANAVRTGDPTDGVDRALLKASKPVEGLETFATQFALFDGLPPADQANLLAGVAQEAAEVREHTRTIAWLTGDLAVLERDAEAGILRFPQLRETLLDSRNRRWAEHIDSTLRNGKRPFVAVGAAHMLGDGGLPALLAEQGYTVRRLR